MCPGPNMRSAVGKRQRRPFAKESRLLGAEVILVHVPIKFRVYREFIRIPPHSPLRTLGRVDIAAAKIHGIPQIGVCVPCVDLTARLQQAVREDVNPYPLTDTHWNSEGHAVVAAELERVLRDLEQQPSLPHQAGDDQWKR
jgi:SGNH hydrolase-like domain, acetyltransferase AlgX